MLGAVVAFVATVLLVQPQPAETRLASKRQFGARVYWGAYIEGPQTFTYRYGGTWGDAPWDSATWSRFEADAGAKVAILHYGQQPPWEAGFDARAADLVVRRGAIPAIDMSTGKVPLREIASGIYDDAVMRWARAAKAWAHPFFLALDVEMNGGWEPYSPGVNGNTAADFVRAWRHLHDLFVRAGATNVTWVWCPNVDPGARFTPYRELYPGEAYVDWTGLDGFARAPQESFGWLFGSSYRTLLALAPTKPILIGQVAAVDDGTAAKANWIRDALGMKLPRRFPRVKAVLWFNWRILEGGVWWDWEIESSNSAERAFAGTVSAPYYASRGRFRPPPLLSKVEPL